VGKSPQYTQNRGWEGSGACLDILEKIKSLLALSGIELQLLKYPQHSLVTMLSYTGSTYGGVRKKEIKEKEVYSYSNCSDCRIL